MNPSLTGNRALWYQIVSKGASPAPSEPPPGTGLRRHSRHSNGALSTTLLLGLFANAERR